MKKLNQMIFQVFLEIFQGLNAKKERLFWGRRIQIKSFLAFKSNIRIFQDLFEILFKSRLSYVKC